MNELGEIWKTKDGTIIWIVMGQLSYGKLLCLAWNSTIEHWWATDVSVGDGFVENGHITQHQSGPLPVSFP